MTLGAGIAIAAIWISLIVVIGLSIFFTLRMQEKSRALKDAMAGIVAIVLFGALFAFLSTTAIVTGF